MNTKTYEYLTERIRKYENLKMRADDYGRYIKDLTLTANKDFSVGVKGIGSICLDESCTEKVRLSTIEVLKERIPEMEKEMEEI